VWLNVADANRLKLRLTSPRMRLFNIYSITLYFTICCVKTTLIVKFHWVKKSNSHLPHFREFSKYWAVLTWRRAAKICRLTREKRFSLKLLDQAWKSLVKLKANHWDRSTTCLLWTGLLPVETWWLPFTWNYWHWLKLNTMNF